MPNDRLGLGSTNWQGGYAGRPELASMLWPALLHFSGDWTGSSIRSVLGALRRFFRFLDIYQKTFPGDITDEQLSGVIGVLWLRPPSQGTWPTPSRGHYNFVARLFYHVLGKDRFFWPSASHKHYDSKDVATEEQARAAFHLLSGIAKNIFRRWQQADELAACGRNLLDYSRNALGRFEFLPTEADVHATYRAVIARTGNALPTGWEIRSALGMRPDSHVPGFWKRLGLTLADVQFGLYPSLEDLFCLSQLFMARTGWNPSTVYSLDISNPLWARPHGNPEHDIWMMESWKERSGDWQYTLCRGRVKTGPLNIVKMLLERTRPLRTLLVRDCTRLPELLRNEDTTEEQRALRVEVATRGPWLAAGSLGSIGTICSLATGSWTESSRWFRRQAAARNEEIRSRTLRFAAENAGNDRPSAPPVQIPLNFRPSDWRDIFASRVFEDSRYNWLVVQWALGHKHLSTTRHYLRTRLWRDFSEKRLKRLQEVLFEELERGCCDPVVLHARVEMNFDATDDDRERLARYRARVSRVGYLCQTPYTPPPAIDPGNPRDGSTPCRQGSRCPGCPAARAFDLKAMVLRLVELEKIRELVSVVVWSDSQLSSDLDQLKRDLTQWPADEVAVHLTFWEEEFGSGRRLLDPWSGLST